MSGVEVPGAIFYEVDQGLFRFGNSTEPRLDHVRKSDVDVYFAEGSLYVRANGRGISLLTEKAAWGRRGGWLWKLPAHVLLPAGMLYHHDRPGHYALCPAYDMKIERYLDLLRTLG